jgi:hypothetical protein
LISVLVREIVPVSDLEYENFSERLEDKDSDPARLLARPLDSEPPRLTEPVSNLVSEK